MRGSRNGKIEENGISENRGRKMMLQIAGAAATVIAIIGVVLNNHLNRKCFYFWIVSNILSAGIHVCYLNIPLVIRDVVFLALAFQGLRKWRKNNVPAS